MTITVLFTVFIICFLLTVPIAIALGISTIVAVTYSGGNYSQIIQSFFTGTDSFPLMAVPFFILAGIFMGGGGISHRILNLSSMLVGKYTGGLALVTICACMFFGAISGSAAATVAAIGTLMVPDMVKNGYNKSFSAALMASAGGLGAIIPPSLSMIIYCVATETSISELFMAGIIPGVIIASGLMIYVYLYSKKHHHFGNKKRFSIKEKFDILKESGWAVLAPIIILGGIYGGIFTPTEAAVVALFYGWFVGTFIYKELKISQLPNYLLTAAAISSVLLIIIGASKGFAMVLIKERLPAELSSFVLSITDNKILILLIINVLLLIVGSFMETLAAIAILAPIFLPVIKNIGVDPVHFGLIMCVNLAIGYVTPPLGANLFVAASVTQVSFSNICKKILPFIIVMIITLLLLIYIPQLSMFLPNLIQRDLSFSEAISF